jgi:hypothetical protein
MLHNRFRCWRPDRCGQLDRRVLKHFSEVAVRLTNVLLL